MASAKFDRGGELGHHQRFALLPAGASFGNEARAAALTAGSSRHAEETEGDESNHRAPDRLLVAPNMSASSSEEHESLSADTGVSSVGATDPNVHNNDFRLHRKEQLPHSNRLSLQTAQATTPPTANQEAWQQQQQTGAAAAPFTDGISSQPALLPFVNRDFHDSFPLPSSPRLTTKAPADTLQPRLATTETSIPSNAILTQPNEGQQAADSNSGADPKNIAERTAAIALSGQNSMGYSSSNNNTSWRAPHRLGSWEIENSSIKQEPQRQRQQQQQPHSINMEHERKERDDDSTTIRSADTASLGSPANGPLVGLPSASLVDLNRGGGEGDSTNPNHTANNDVVGAQSAVTTPSTVSTAPSTNDEGEGGSMGALLDAQALDRLALRGEALDSSSALFQHHRRGPSWETHSSNNSALYQSQLYVRDEADPGAFGRSAALPPPQTPTSGAPNAWGNPHTSQQRIASFRNEYNASVAAQEQQRWRVQQPPQAPSPHHPYGPAQRPVPQQQHHQQQPVYGPYPQQRTAQSSNLAAATPPRTARTPRGVPPGPSPHRPSPSSAAGSSQPASHVSGGGSNPRSPSEVLKTLLRKKACLYEPDTSRAVALATWLVGRELALEFGYFSRQQLQAGVHACVASKIDSGVITRTKVNRCMQIILNSCFHYIIPRPDGTEENGEAFGRMFATEVTDDMRLLRELPAPWNDLFVDRDIVLEASAADQDGKKSAPSTPQSSPRLGSIPTEKAGQAKEDDGDSKRAVLLCFNENVRCAEDVFRCHNEFIRDTAHASGLQLSSNEWRAFFGKEAAGSPFLWGNIGIPVPRADNSLQADALGMMTRSELAKFRTTWCSKRYDHDHELCGFAHADVNGGWMRRNFAHHEYGLEMCPEITTYPSSRGQGNRKYVVNACPRGVNCGFAHSSEEILFHPRRYKRAVCPNLTRPGGCPSSDVCSNFHPVDSYKFPSKKGEGRQGSRQNQPRGQQGASSSSGNKGAPQPPTGAPVLYCSPAPISRFEEQFQLPGLKNLYRRHCSVVRAHLRNPGSCVCCYSCFGDDNGTAMSPKVLQQQQKSSSPTAAQQPTASAPQPKRGLPQPRRY